MWGHGTGIDKSDIDSCNVALSACTYCQKKLSYGVGNGEQEMEPYLSDADFVLYNGLWNDCVAGFYCRGAEYLWSTYMCVSSDGFLLCVTDHRYCTIQK